MKTNTTHSRSIEEQDTHENEETNRMHTNSRLSAQGYTIYMCNVTSCCVLCIRKTTFDFDFD